MRTYMLDKKWTCGSEYSFFMVEPTTKKEERIVAYVCDRERPLIKYRPQIAKYFYGNQFLATPDYEEMFFLMKFFSLGNREKGAIRAARWLCRHGMAAGYDKETGRIRVWPKQK